MKKHEEIYLNHCMFSQKREGSKIAHIWSDELDKNLCGIEYMLAYFKPVAGWIICPKCLKIYNQSFHADTQSRAVL